ncbi:MAG: Crp/Fnr family transcriptional regulator [Thermodesulfobacteriota bacterium]
MTKIRDLVAAIPLFQGMRGDDYDELAMIVVDQEVARATPIFSEGEPGNGFFVVISGRVKIFKLSMDGKEQILHIFGPGEPFAEVAVFTGSPYPANAIALEKSRIFFFPRQAFIELISAHPSLAMNMLATLSFRLKQFAHLIETLSLKEVPGRLAAYLLLAREREGDGNRVELAVSRTQLASLLGTIPETLSRILSRMSSQSIIATEGSRITILDEQALTALADGETRLG